MSAAEAPPISTREALTLLVVGAAAAWLAGRLGAQTGTLASLVPVLPVLAWIGPAWWLTTRRGADPLVALALGVRPRGLGLAAGVSLALLSGFVLVLLARAGGPRSPVGPALAEAAGTLVWHLAFVALPEETFFRGVLQPALQREGEPGLDLLGARVGRAVVVQALLFGAAHVIVDLASGQAVQPLRALTVLPGLWFGWLRVRTGSVVPGIVSHALANATLLACDRTGLLAGSA